MKKIEVVCAVLHDQSGRVLIAQRRLVTADGVWEFPGGKVETGETSAQALVREIREELDTEIEVGELFDTVEYDYPSFHLSMDCFL